MKPNTVNSSIQPHITGIFHFQEACMSAHFYSVKSTYLLAALLIFGFGKLTFAKKYPIPKPSDVETLKGTKSGTGV
jgi:hypothetical protein